MMTQRFDINADLFMAVRRCAQADAWRYYLQGVYIEPIPEGGAWLVATDGIGMLVARDKGAVAARAAIVGLDVLAMAADDDEPRSIWGRISFDLDPAQATLAWQGSADHRTLVGVVAEIAAPHLFPDWRRVWCDPANHPVKTTPGIPTPTCWGLRMTLLKQIAGDEPIRLVTAAEHGPSVILFDRNPDLLGLVIPTGFDDAGAPLATELRLAGDAAARKAGETAVKAST
jgi:hypothetical protein